MGTAEIKRATIVAAVALLASVAGGPGLVNAEDGSVAPPAAQGTVVLDAYSIWRMHFELAPVVLWTGETHTYRWRWLNYRTPPPRDGWAGADFDDRFWHRGPLGAGVKSALLSRACLRGKFTVTDPETVHGLRFSAAYRGGIVVRVNGTEVHREHVAEGAAVADGPSIEERETGDLPIPTSLLRPGTNVVALEVVRAPYPESGGEAWQAEAVFSIDACDILRARLSADDDSGLVPSARRPEGLQVWNADPMAGDQSLDFGNEAEPLRPVTIICARNGLFTGKVVLGSTEPVRGLKVTPGGISGEGGTIPASALRIRYGIPWGEEGLIDISRIRSKSPYPTWATLMGALAEEPLDEFAVMPPVQTGQWYRFREPEPGQPAPVPGAVVPIWITVKVPKDIGAGTYAGGVKIEVEGEHPRDVPLELRVADWALPDTQDYRTWVDIMQCVDTPALEYDVPLWSDRHFEMIARSLRLIGETGCRTLYIPLIAHTNIGDEESMVRWIRKGEGYDHDFSVMERYLDLAEENMGRPKVLVFVVWDYYMIPRGTAGQTEGRGRQSYAAKYLDKVGGQYGDGPKVTILGRDTGQTEVVTLPPHSDPAASRPLWQPLFDELRLRLRERGLEGAMMLGLQGDAWASKEDVAFFHEVAPGVPWAMHSHEGHYEDRLQYGMAKIGYQARVWTVSFSDDGADRRTETGTIESLHGWSREGLCAQYDRLGRDHQSCTQWRHLAESVITGSQRGPARLGGEFWEVLRNKKGERVGRAYARYPESDWRNLVILTSTLAPGPDGPVATNHLEALRQGVQECEARIVLERALGDDALRARLGEDLVRQCEECLHARHMMMFLSLSSLQCYYSHLTASWRSWMAKDWRGGTAKASGHYWFLGSEWPLRTWRLFSLAGDVDRKLGAE